MTTPLPDPTGAGVAAMPQAEVEIEIDLVRRLLADQHPDLAGLPLAELANGWDNMMYRLGDDLTVRLPRRLLAAQLIEHEQRWLPALAPELPLPIPTPVRTGRATGYYPWSWSVLPWLEGRAAATDPTLDGRAAAADLGRFLAALHRSAPDNAPRNPYRGGPLAERDPHVRDRLDRLAASLHETTPISNPSGCPLDAETLLARWERCLAAPPWQGPAIWLHGDLHGHNILSAGGRLTAVIDFGDITAGDPATDLAAAWSVLDVADHEPFRRAADTGARPIDEAMWLRAEGWALSIGLALLANSADSPAMEALGRRMIDSSTP